MDKQKTSMAKLVFKPPESKPAEQPLSERFKQVELPDLDAGLRRLLLGNASLSDLHFPKPKR